jgi:hypothetical protein
MQIVNGVDDAAAADAGSIVVDSHKWAWSSRKLARD